MKKNLNQGLERILKLLQKIPLWLVSGILYGFSWPLFQQPDLSFLAWFAFVPLFFYLQRHQGHFWKFIGGSYGTMLVFAFFSAGWLYAFPDSTWRIGVIFFAEVIYFTIPFLILYFLQKRLTFSRALWLLPLVWPVWEWFYLSLEFTMGTHLLAYSQTNNLWLIQLADIGGMWLLDAWVILFNVLIWNAWKRREGKLFSKSFVIPLVKVATGMLILPILYAVYSFYRFDAPPKDAIEVSLIPTRFAPEYLMNPENNRQVLEGTLYRTDSLAFARMDQGLYNDLYVWPETGTNFSLDYENLASLLQEAVDDYEASMLFGCKGIPDEYSENDWRTYVSGVLVSHSCSPETPPSFQFHHKTVLTPGNESFPYLRYLSRVPGFPIKETDPHFRKPGLNRKPLALHAKSGKTYRAGVSLCFEQWYPSFWAALAREGAGFYVHLAGEGWYGKVGFQQFMANVSRLRCIENRRSAARCANVGLSLFIDPLGRYYNEVPKGTVFPSTAKVGVGSYRSFYSRFPDLFPWLFLVLGIGAYLYSRIRKPGSSS